MFGGMGVVWGSVIIMLRRKLERREALPYSRLASIYDYVMRHVDYVHWADYVESLLRRHGLVPVRVLDLACGTGSLAVELGKRGYKVVGADGCEEMLAVAREKVRMVGHDVSFYHQDLLHLEGLPQVEWVLCLYDSINYLMTLEEVSRALEEIHGVVQPGGIFIFDVCTETNSLRYFRDMTDKDRGNGFSYTRRSYYNNGVQFNRFDIYFTDTQEEVCEVHRQRIYPLSDVEGVLEASPFRVEGAYDGFGFSPASDQSDRVHFVLRA